MSYHVVMSAATDLADGLEQALHRRGDPMSATEFLDVLDEISTVSSAPLTSGERDFLLETTELTTQDLSASARQDTRLAVARSTRSVNRDLADQALTTSEVAALLGRADANVRRSRLSGDLYSINPGDHRGLRFPRWQFTDEGRPTPGLRQVIPAFPRYLHPVAIERFMTTASDSLDGLNPVDWLAGGGPVDVVVELADELGHV